MWNTDGTSVIIDQVFLSHLCDVECSQLLINFFSVFLSHLCDVELNTPHNVIVTIFLSHLCDVECKYRGEECGYIFLSHLCDVESYFTSYSIKRNFLSEPSRDCRRPKTLRQYSYEKQTIPNRS